MQATNTTPSVPAQIQACFQIIDGRPMTTSRHVAEIFGKRHDAVMRDIDNLIKKKPELYQFHNFVEMIDEVETGKGARRQVKIYAMDRKGFSLLAMGFTGEKALEFKIAFYDQFEYMEAIIQKKAISEAVSNLEITTLTPEQQYTLKEAVKSRAKKQATSYQTIYRAIYARYKIARYEQLPQAKLEDCLNFIKTVDLRVPDQQKPLLPQNCTTFDENGCCPHCGRQPVPEGAKILTKERQRALYNQIKPLLDEAEQSMRIIEQQRIHAWTCYHELRLLLIGVC